MSASTCHKRQMKEHRTCSSTWLVRRERWPWRSRGRRTWEPSWVRASKMDQPCLPSCSTKKDVHWGTSKTYDSHLPFPYNCRQPCQLAVAFRFCQIDPQESWFSFLLQTKRQNKSEQHSPLNIEQSRPEESLGRSCWSWNHIILDLLIWWVSYGSLRCNKCKRTLHVTSTRLLVPLFMPIWHVMQCRKPCSFWKSWFFWPETKGKGSPTLCHKNILQEICHAYVPQLWSLHHHCIFNRRFCEKRHWTQIQDAWRTENWSLSTVWSHLWNGIIHKRLLQLL